MQIKLYCIVLYCIVLYDLNFSYQCETSFPGVKSFSYWLYDSVKITFFKSAEDFHRSFYCCLVKSLFHSLFPNKRISVFSWLTFKPEYKSHSSKTFNNLKYDTLYFNKHVMSWAKVASFISPFPMKTHFILLFFRIAIASNSCHKINR